MRMRLLLAWIAGVVVVITGCSTTAGESGVTPQPQAAPVARTNSTAPPLLTTPPSSSAPSASNVLPSSSAPPTHTTPRANAFR